MGNREARRGDKVVFEVLRWAEWHGRMVELVRALQKARPRNRDVQVITDEVLTLLSAESAPPGRVADGAPLLLHDRSTEHSRSIALAGSWQGWGIERDPQDKVSGYPISMTLEVSGDRAFGIAYAEYRQPATARVDLTCWGFFKQNCFLCLEYRNLDQGMLDFGYALLKLNGAGTKLTGGLAGYGPLSDAVVAVGLKFEKTNPLSIAHPPASPLAANQ